MQIKRQVVSYVEWRGKKKLKLNYLWLFYIYKNSLSLHQPSLKTELNLRLYDKSYIELQNENVIEFFFCHQDKKKFTFFRAYFFISSIDSEFQWQNTKHDTEQTVDKSGVVKSMAGRNIWMGHRIFL
jgi:hypothetical protein